MIPRRCSQSCQRHYTLHFTCIQMRAKATSWLAATWSFWHTFRLNDSSSSWHLRRKWGNSFRFWQKRAGANPREDLQPWVTGVATPYMSTVRNYLGSSLGMVMDGAILYHSYITCNYITTKWCDYHLPCAEYLSYSGSKRLGFRLS